MSDDTNELIQAIKHSLRETAKRNPKWRHVELEYEELRGKALTADQVIERIEKDPAYAMTWKKRAAAFAVKQMGDIYGQSGGSPGGTKV